MSTYANSLKKQIELLQAELEIYANAVDNLAGQLADARQQLAMQQDNEANISEMAPASEAGKDRCQPSAAPSVSALQDAGGYPKILTPDQACQLYEEMKGFQKLPEGKITNVPALLNQ